MEGLFDISINMALPMFSSSILASIEELQLQQTPPFSDGVYFIDLRRKFLQREGTLFFTALSGLIDPLFNLMFQSDAIYANLDSTKYSLVKVNEEYHKYTEGLQYKFPGYIVDKNSLVKNFTDKEIVLKDLKSFLLSNESDTFENLHDEFFGKQARFLKGKQDFMHISYASYPRSGNTFLRKYLESITGLATGSDMVMKFTLNTCLQYSGFKGEGIVDDRCWINKTHFPFRLPYDKEYKTNAIICCVRNPLDVLVSNFLLMATMSHNKGVIEKFWEFEEWDPFVTNELLAIQKWHQYWIDLAAKKEVPIFFVRFEDLLQNPKKHLTEVFEFLLSEENLNGTNVEKRINEVLKEGNGSVLYKVKSGGGSVNRHLDKYNEAQLDRVMSILENMNHYFGYAKVDDNPLGFFDYKGKASQNSMEQFEYFKKSNEKMKSWVCQSQADKIRQTVQFRINRGKDGFSLINTKDCWALKNVPYKSTIKEQ